LFSFSLYDSLYTQRALLFETLSVIVSLFLLTFVLKYTVLAFIILKTNEKIHNRMLKHLMRTEVVFFDKNPSGRILNNFSNDMGILDL